MEVWNKKYFLYLTEKKCCSLPHFKCHNNITVGTLPLHPIKFYESLWNQWCKIGGDGLR
jgi:hypothetical protein